jgi:hypothetical protein
MLLLVLKHKKRVWFHAAERRMAARWPGFRISA